MPPAVSTAPSLGYDPDQRAPGDATHEADALHEALKAYPTTDASTLIRILAGPDPLEMALIRDTYASRHGHSLTKDILSQTTGPLAATLAALADGPLDQDLTHLHDGFIINNNSNNNSNADTPALTDVLIGRSNADLRAIKYAYVNKYGTALVDTIRSSGGPAGPFFAQLLGASRPENAAFFDQGAVEDDVRALHAALLAADEVSVGELFLAASDARLAAVAAAFEARYQVGLEAAVWESGFAAAVKEVLRAMVAHAVDPVLRDAGRLVRVGGGTRRGRGGCEGVGVLGCAAALE
ncbi:Annexin [Aspergillus campestris IBT 28561]|uniref:Annexin n=1 Tax=Aspergillus campestris (strain IBT 28561) TaxID=1392248 RepID=A0A2I1DB48_ASPC2|nr:Annexin [Aspergillus campestris IBT 28561]PKY07097.1 Annexin [Aspergillus campestris IBT 28561]